MPENEESNDDGATSETQFVPQPNDDELLYEVEEITAERGNKYRVRWAGVNPITGKPWPQDWVDKRDCTNLLIAEWKEKKKSKALKKRGSRTLANTKSRRSTSTSGASVARNARSSAVSEPIPQILSPENPLPPTSTLSVEKPHSKKRKRGLQSPESLRGDGVDEAKKRKSRMRKKQKTTMEAVSRATASASREDLRAISREIIQTPEANSSWSCLDSEPETQVTVLPVKVGPPRGVKRQNGLEKGKGRLQRASKKVPSPHSKVQNNVTTHHEVLHSNNWSPSPSRPTQMSKPVVEATGSQASLASASGATVVATSKTVGREHALSPGALERLKIFDRAMAELPNSVTTSHDPGTMDVPFSPPKSPPFLPTSAGGSITETESSGTSPNPFHQHSLPDALLTSPHFLDLEPENGEMHQAKHLDGLDFPEIAVMSRSTSPVDELTSTPAPPPRHTNAAVHTASPKVRGLFKSCRPLKSIPQLSPNTIKSSLKPYRIIDPSAVTEPPPSSIESFATPQAPVRRKPKRRKRKGALVVGDGGSEASNNGIEHDEVDGNPDLGAEEQVMTGCPEEVRPTDSEVRKRGQELFDQEQRKRKARRDVVSKPKQFKRLKEIVSSTRLRPSSSVVRAAFAVSGLDDAENNGVGADRLESAVQQQEDPPVDNGGDSGSRATSSPPLTTTLNAALRMQLRQEEEESTQETGRLISTAQDPASYTFDYSDLGMQHAVDPETSEPVHTELLDGFDQTSAPTEELQRASVIVQPSQGGKPSNTDDLNAPLASLRRTGSPPQESPTDVTSITKQHLVKSLSLLNMKSEEIRRLERELADERQKVINVQVERAKLAKECEFLHTFMAEERTRLADERAKLEAERARWTTDRVTWTDELKLWKEAHDVWEKQCNGWSESLEKTERSIDMAPSEEKRAGSEGAGRTVPSEEEKNKWESHQEMLIKERDALLRTVAELSSSVDAISSAKSSAEKDRDFFREQYVQASSFVTGMRAENIALEERAKIAESQAQEGVASIRALFENKVKALHDDIYRWKTLAEMLQAKDERTNDQVRSRAAQATELEDLCKTLLEEKRSLETHLRKLRRVQQKVFIQRNQLQRKVLSLTKERACLRTKLAKYPTFVEPLGPTREPTTTIHDTSDLDPNLPVSQSMSPPTEESSFDGDAWFPCLWRPQLRDQCLKIFDSKEDLQRHIQEHLQDRIR